MLFPAELLEADGPPYDRPTPKTPMVTDTGLFHSPLRTRRMTPTPRSGRFVNCDRIFNPAKAEDVHKKTGMRELSVFKSGM
jgi:hypothetical protein